MTLKSLAAAAALVVAAAGSHAAVVGTIDLSSGSAGFANTPGAGTFSDVFNITPTFSSANVLTGSVITVVSGNQNIDFSSIVLTNTTSLVTYALNKQTGDPFELWTTPTAGYTLPAGTYTLTLNGSNSAGIASYAGNLAITAVPEPQALALMLAGIGAVGFVAGRRRS